jgi:hypothetical protein
MDNVRKLINCDFGLIFNNTGDECETWSLTLRGERRLEVISEQGAEENISTEEG